MKSELTITFDNLGEAAIALGFLKLIRGHLPNQHQVRPMALAILDWMYRETLTDEEKQEATEVGLITPSLDGA
jgi:hypothetical protein